eukprot:3356735-Rhodomonas_salina.3
MPDLSTAHSTTPDFSTTPHTPYGNASTPKYAMPGHTNRPAIIKSKKPIPWCKADGENSEMALISPGRQLPALPSAAAAAGGPCDGDRASATGGRSKQGRGKDQKG